MTSQIHTPRRNRTHHLPAALLVLFAVTASAQTPSSSAPSASPAPPAKALPFSISVMERSRTDAVDFYSDAPHTSTYPYTEQLLRISVAQSIKHFDYQVEVSENDLFDLPSTSFDPATGPGQLFLGGTYYAANSNKSQPVAASLRQAFVCFHGKGPDTTLRVGRFEFFEGQETIPKDPTPAWLQTNRVAQRLVGNFGSPTPNEALTASTATSEKVPGISPQWPEDLPRAYTT